MTRKQWEKIEVTYGFYVPIPSVLRAIWSPHPDFAGPDGRRTGTKAFCGRCFRWRPRVVRRAFNATERDFEMGAYVPKYVDRRIPAQFMDPRSYSDSR